MTKAASSLDHRKLLEEMRRKFEERRKAREAGKIKGR